MENDKASHHHCSGHRHCSEHCISGAAIVSAQSELTDINDQPSRVSIAYIPPSNSTFQALYGVLKAHHALEKIQEILSPLHWPEELTIKTAESGVVNSWYGRENFKPTVTDASHDALNHAAGVAAGYRMDGQNCQGRAETQDAEGAQASRLSMQIAIQAEHDSDQGCSTEPKRNVESVHSGKNFSTTASRRLQPRWLRARAIADLCRGSPLGACTM